MDVPVVQAAEAPPIADLPSPAEGALPFGKVLEHVLSDGPPLREPESPRSTQATPSSGESPPREPESPPEADPAGEPSDDTAADDPPAALHGAAAGSPPAPEPVVAASVLAGAPPVISVEGRADGDGGEGRAFAWDRAGGRSAAERLWGFWVRRSAGASGAEGRAAPVPGTSPDAPCPPPGDPARVAPAGAAAPRVSTPGEPPGPDDGAWPAGSARSAGDRPSAAPGVPAAPLGGAEATSPPPATGPDGATGPDRSSAAVFPENGRRPPGVPAGRGLPPVRPGKGPSAEAGPRPAAPSDVPPRGAPGAPASEEAAPLRGSHGTPPVGEALRRDASARETKPPAGHAPEGPRAVRTGAIGAPREGPSAQPASGREGREAAPPDDAPDPPGLRPADPSAVKADPLRASTPAGEGLPHREAAVRPDELPGEPRAPAIGPASGPRTGAPDPGEGFPGREPPGAAAEAREAPRAREPRGVAGAPAPGAAPGGRGPRPPAAPPQDPRPAAGGGEHQGNLQGLARSVRLAWDRGRGEVRVRLDPPSLGRVHVTLSRDAEGVVARLKVETTEALNLLAASTPALRLALESRGLEVSHVSVALGGRGDSEGDRPRARRDRTMRRGDGRSPLGGDEPPVSPGPGWRARGFETLI